jgi:hypothetical protein
LPERAQFQRLAWRRQSWSPSTSAQHLGASPAGHGAFGGFGHAGAAHGAGS